MPYHTNLSLQIILKISNQRGKTDSNKNKNAYKL